ncbi:hypothetical protein Pan44_39810 [Caulifigura coniformis]|uniref:Uncharacterized protein n=1 Tax=Caulifigura coniformis TaxID=2527983 RepID=A0A517SIG9_9PLAN|nr:hypothetical protein [Caulifigura coniformis]QDT55933.1 hypothetical protein Pan44_39810 [Caulifigura coniformis]
MTTTDNNLNLVAAARRLLEAREDQMLTPVEWDALQAAVDAMGERVTPYYVATLTRYVVVDALHEDNARAKGHAALVDLYARSRKTNDLIEIQTVRPAMADEVAMCAYHAAKVAEEEARTNS